MTAECGGVKERNAGAKAETKNCRRVVEILERLRALRSGSGSTQMRKRRDSDVSGAFLSVQWVAQRGSSTTTQWSDQFSIKSPELATS